MPSHSSEEKLPLSYNITKKGIQWDPDTYSFNVTQSTAGLYFVALSVGANLYAPVNYILHKSGRRFGGKTRTFDIENAANIISRDFLIPLYATDTLHVSSQYLVYSASGQSV